MIVSGMIVLSHIWKVWNLHLGDDACLRNRTTAACQEALEVNGRVIADVEVIQLLSYQGAAMVDGTWISRSGKQSSSNVARVIVCVTCET